MSSADHEARLMPWLRLMYTEGIGARTAQRLLTAFGTPQAIWQASLPQLCDVVPARQAQALYMKPSPLARACMARAIAWAGVAGQRIMTLDDVDYPQALFHIPDPPPLLYIKGHPELLSATSLAVVGSRHASMQGLRNAESFSEALSQAGIGVVSGLALGIDTAAHEGSLRGVGASLAVLGTGPDIVYPPRNAALAQRLAQSGCLVSEYALGTPPLAANFPRRNRIISGLARAVLVVEAAAQSGSLITARMAVEQGRDVLAIPGSIHAPLSKGCHALIKQGAKLVESVDDILCELGQLPKLASTAPIAPSGTVMPEAGADRLWQALGFDPVDADTLSLRCGLDAAALHARLLELELDGVVEALPGARYRRVN